MKFYYRYPRIENAFILTAFFLVLLCCAAVADSAQDQPRQQFSFGVNIIANQSGIDPEGDSAAQAGKKPQKPAAAAEPSGEKKDPQLQLVMVGDVLMHRGVINAGKQEDGSLNYDYIFENVRETVQAADLALVNQETILGGSELGLYGYPVFNSPYELGDAEVKSGFNTVLHATNHAYDMEKKGIMNCIRFWENEHPDIACLGINASQKHQEDYLYVYEKDGIRVAVLNYTYGINGGSVPYDQSYLINELDERRVVSDIARAHKKADFVIVCPHWGTEYSLDIDESQKRWTQIFFENGVDLVIGTHPHVIEPIEWLTDEHGRDMLVYYSLGNFINGLPISSDPDILNRTVGGMAQVTIGLDADGDAVIKEYGIEPLICHCENGKYTTYFLSDYTEELAKKNRFSEKISGYSMEKCRRLVRQVWGEDACGVLLKP